MQKEQRIKATEMVEKTDQALALLDASKRAAYLTRQSTNFAIDVLNAYKQLSLDLIVKMTDYSALNFNTDENL